MREAIDSIKQFPETLVDCSFGQGRDMFLKQLEERNGRDEEDSVDAYIEDCQNTITGLVRRAKPYNVPDDYIFFLENYGGLFLWDDKYTLSLLGTGPMVEEWYSSVVSDDALLEAGQYGFLTIGSLNFNEQHKYKFQYVTFFLDLAGNVQKHCVIGVGPWGAETLTPLDILPGLHDHPDRWRKTANSFTEWLEQAADTKGAFGYDQ
jgi:hypothetical protein